MNPGNRRSAAPSTFAWMLNGVVGTIAAAAIVSGTIALASPLPAEARVPRSAEGELRTVVGQPSDMAIRPEDLSRSEYFFSPGSQDSFQAPNRAHDDPPSTPASFVARSKTSLVCQTGTRGSLDSAPGPTVSANRHGREDLARFFGERLSIAHDALCGKCGGLYQAIAERAGAEKLDRSTRHEILERVEQLLVRRARVRESTRDPLMRSRRA